MSRIRTLISPFNLVFLSLWTAFGVWGALVGRWGVTAAAGVVLVVISLLIWDARGGESDYMRIAAAEPADERERSSERWAFAVTGMFAIFATTAHFLYDILTTPRDGGLPPSFAVFMATMVVWGVAQSIAVRRQ